jgi:hypothetical protein
LFASRCELLFTGHRLILLSALEPTIKLATAPLHSVTVPVQGVAKDLGFNQQARKKLVIWRESVELSEVDLVVFLVAFVIVH